MNFLCFTVWIKEYKKYKAITIIATLFIEYKIKSKVPKKRPLKKEVLFLISKNEYNVKLKKKKKYMSAKTVFRIFKKGSDSPIKTKTL